jgi:hypothetical protein
MEGNDLHARLPAIGAVLRIFNDVDRETVTGMILFK